jgi:hypothetical protein
MNRKLPFLLLFLLARLAVFGQGSWKLNADKDGIKIYTAQIPDSKIKAIKVECEVEASPSQLVALLMDVNTSTDWLYHTKTCRLLKQVSPADIYYYSEVNLPWPAENRDFVAHLMVKQNPDTKVITIDGPAVPGMVPEKKGVVRIEHSTGKWTITPCGQALVKVEYTLHTEPGGNIPAWMVNMFATQGPLQVFENLKRQVQKPAYKNATLSYIENPGSRLYSKL